DRGYDPQQAGRSAAALSQRHRCRSEAALSLRHRRSRDAGRRRRAGALRAGGRWSGDRSRLARPQRSRACARKRALRWSRRCDSLARMRGGERWAAGRGYSGVPGGEFCEEQQIEIAPISGLSNVKHWLARHEIPADEPLAKAVLARAKASNRTLTESEVAQIVREVRS